MKKRALTKRALKSIAVLAGAVAMLPAVACACATAAPPPSPPANAMSVPGWDQLVDSLRTLHAQDRFDVLVSAQRPAGYTGDWRELSPAATRLMLRMDSSDWAHEHAGTIAIERIDKPATRPRPTAAALEARLRALSITSR